MSSGTAMNRKIQRENKNSSKANLTVRKGPSVNEHMAQSGIHPRVALRQENNIHPRQASVKHLNGTPAQKNWYLLSVHEKRLNRLEAWVQMMVAGRMDKSSDILPPKRHDTSGQQRPAMSQQSSSLTGDNAQKIQPSKVVTLEVNETNAKN